MGRDADKATPSTEPWIGFETSGCLMGNWKNVGFAVWAKQGTIELIGELARTSSEFTKREPGRISSVHLLVNQAPLPDAQTRAALTAISEEYAPRLACVGTVIEGTGFWASAMRGLVTSLQLVVPNRTYKSHICGTTKALAAWLAEPHTRDTGVPVDAAELEAVLDALLARPSIAGTRKL